MEQSVASWRAMTPDDIDEVVVAAEIVHPGFFEERSVFAERLQLFPEGARILEGEGRVIGYALSHPWRRGEVPCLNSLLGGIPGGAETYYIHDLALLPIARGKHAAGRLIGALIFLAKEFGFPSMSLVAVNGSRFFWEKQGFCVVDLPVLSKKLASYEATAVLMEKHLR